MDRNSKIYLNTGFGLLIALIFLIASFGAAAMNAQREMLERFNDETIVELTEMQQANSDIITLRQTMEDMVESDSDIGLVYSEAMMKRNDEAVRKHLHNALEVTENPELYKAVAKAYEDWALVRSQTLELRRQGPISQQAADRIKIVDKTNVDIISGNLTRLLNSETQEIEQFYQEIDKASNKTFILLVISALFGTATAIAVAIFVTGRLASMHKKIYDAGESRRITLESIADGVITTDVEERIISMNRAAETMTGWQEADAAGRPLAEVFRITGDRPGMQVPDPVHEALAADSVRELSNHAILISKDGTERNIADSAAPIRDDSGVTTGVVMIVRDVTERRRMDEALRESERSKSILLSNLPGVAYRCKLDRKWTMEFVSDGVRELLGYEPEDLVGNAVLAYEDVILPKYRDHLWAEWLEKIGNSEAYRGNDVFQDEYEVRTATGEIKWVWERGRGIFDDQGRVIALEGVIFDDSARKAWEDQIVHLSSHDGLTGLYNRTYFDDVTRKLNMPGKLPLSVIMGDINGLKLTNDIFGYAAGDRLLIEITNIFKKCCRNEDIIARTGGDEFTVLMPGTAHETVESICRDIYRECENHDNWDPVLPDNLPPSIALGWATKMEAGESLDAVFMEAEDHMFKRKLLEHKSMHSSLMSSIRTTLSEKNHETEEHAERLVKMARKFGRLIGLSDVQLNELDLLASLHDIGKIGIADQILTKPGRLTEEEFAEIRKHPEVGYRIAQASPELSRIAEYILYHHERWDGSGYPEGLDGERIPLLSRIIAMVDAFDAMTQDRPYRSAMSFSEAVEEIRLNAGRQFDPSLADIFISMLADENGDIMQL